MRSSRPSLLAVATLAFAGAGVHVVDASRISYEQSARELRSGTSTQANDPAKSSPQRAAQLRTLSHAFGWSHGPSRRNGYPRPGWSVRQGQRMARKARNQKRARRAGRGRK